MVSDTKEIQKCCLTGSGEDDDLLSTVAVNTITSTGKTATTNFTTIITAKKSTSRETPAKGTATTVHLTSTREPNPTRGRRTVPESDYKIVDLDVSTSQVKILDEGFGKQLCVQAIFLKIVPAISMPSKNTIHFSS